MPTLSESSHNYSRRTIRIATSIVFFCYGLCFASWASRIPTIQQNFSLSESALGGVLFALPIGSLISLPIAGFLVAKVGSKKVVVATTILYIISLWAISLSPTIWLLVVVLFLFGLIGNMVNISVNTQAVALEKIYERNVLASFHGMWSLAGFVGAGVGAYMIGNGISVKQHYTVVAISSLVMAVFSFKYLLPFDDDDEADKPIFALPDKSLMLMGIIAFCGMLCEGAMFDWSGVYLKKVVGVKEELIGLGYTSFMVSMAGTRFIADKVSHRFGVKPVIIVSGCFTVCGLLLAILFPTFASALTGFFIVGIGVSAVIPLLFSAAGKTKTMSPSVALASVSTMGFIGFLLGPPLIGFIAGMLDLRLSFTFVAFMGLTVAVLATQMKKR